ncbi:NAC domain-containing protein 104-like [Senna tora]|uniref:NAC domain-containing protein 104-like n=1 Tax=Senna tora TaxID=362788 RepID=A0A834VZ94_9FABA|nr:NAC domain-containing protein 104-like [Senna tora]
MGDNNNKNVKLPPGFRFYPTDEELLVHFLRRKASLLPCHPDVIPDLDLYPYDPWDLHAKALAEGNQWYYYSRRTQNRVTENGYWMPMGMEEAVIGGGGSNTKVIGMKKYFVFYLGDGVKTNWLMQEYRLSDSASTSAKSSSSSKTKSHPKPDRSKWVICRVYECDEDNDSGGGGGDGTELSCLDEVFLSLDDLEEISLPN